MQNITERKGNLKINILIRKNKDEGSKITIKNEEIMINKREEKF